jgi:hypothetical protein
MWCCWPTISYVPVAIHHGGTAVLSIKARGSYVLVGDMMRSMSLYVFKDESNTFELVCLHCGVCL